MADFDFETLYRSYPRKEGKKRGMNRLRSVIKTLKDYQDFQYAVHSYLSLCAQENREQRYIKHWATFVNNYTDYLTKDNVVKSVTKTMLRSQVERIVKGEL